MDTYLYDADFDWWYKGAAGDYYSESELELVYPYDRISDYVSLLKAMIGLSDIAFNSRSLDISFTCGFKIPEIENYKEQHGC